MLRRSRGLILYACLVASSCKSTKQATPAGAELKSSSSVSETTFIDIERRHLDWAIAQKDGNCTALNAARDWSPEAIIDRLYTYGMEIPPSPNSERGHQNIQSGGYKALRRAFYIAVADDSPIRKACQAELVALLDGWSRFPPACFQFAKSCPLLTKKPIPSTSNRSLELTWLLGNLIRAASILEKYPPSDKTIDTKGTLDRFKKWSGEVINSYVTYNAFSAGTSNRKASQIETLLRYAVLTGNQSMASAQVKGFSSLLHQIKPQGELCEDILRDKFHPQFFIASSLNIVQLIRTKTKIPFQDPILAQNSQDSPLCPTITGTPPENPDDEENDDSPPKDEAPLGIADTSTASNKSTGGNADQPSSSNNNSSGFPWFFLANGEQSNSCNIPPDLSPCRKALTQEARTISPPKTALQAAIVYTAATNVTEAPPLGYESPTYATNPAQNWRPAYNIPTWYLADKYLRTSGSAVPAAVQCMLYANYFRSGCAGRFDFNKPWGYSALADGYQL